MHGFPHLFLGLNMGIIIHIPSNQAASMHPPAQARTYATCSARRKRRPWKGGGNKRHAKTKRNCNYNYNYKIDATDQLENKHP